MSSTSSPCAACKLLRRKCTQECVFAPYFPPDNPQKFSNVHKVFGASNVAKLLNELDASQREDAVNSLAYEAEYRLRDPVYGCVGLISILQHRLSQVKTELLVARKELANYIGPSAMYPMMEHQGMVQNHPGNVASPSAAAVMQYNMQQQSMMGLPTGMVPHVAAPLIIRDPQQQMLEAQQMAAAVAATEQQEMMRNYEHQQQLQPPQPQHEMVRFNSGFDAVTATGFNQMNAAAGGGAIQQPTLALGQDHSLPHPLSHLHGHSHHPQHPHPLQMQPQLMLQHQPQTQPPQQQQLQATTTTHQQQQQHRAKSEERMSRGPSC